MAENAAKRTSRAKAKAEPDELDATTTEAAADDAAADDAASDDTQQQQEGAREGASGTTTPPPPPVDSGDAPTGEQYAKATLVKRADSLLGVTPGLAQALLRDAEDPITIDAAKSRIQGFLDGEVANTEEA